jgi:prophage DNA circulation protein
VVFHDQLRKLWEDHVTWTRMAIVTFAAGSNGFDASAQRLLANQVDIGDAIAPFYGDAAVELLQAAKVSDTTAFTDAQTRWYANSNQIADFLAAANPRSWPADVTRAMMKEHLDQTLAEAADELHGNYTASVADYDAIHQHILEMADMLSSGIMRQFPRKFH